MLFQSAEQLAGKPWIPILQQSLWYGPDNLLIENPDTLPLHYLAGLCQVKETMNKSLQKSDLHAHGPHIDLFYKSMIVNR